MSLDDEIRQHALDEAPRESCGVIIELGGTKEYIRCRNVSDDEDGFLIYPHDYADAEDRGEIVAIVHSHPNGNAEMSPADKEAFEYAEADWMIVARDGTIEVYPLCNQLQE